jgi:hypothetical protein
LGKTTTRRKSAGVRAKPSVVMITARAIGKSTAAKSESSTA